MFETFLKAARERNKLAKLQARDAFIRRCKPGSFYDLDNGGVSIKINADGMRVGACLLLRNPNDDGRVAEAGVCSETEIHEILSAYRQEANLTEHDQDNLLLIYQVIRNINERKAEAVNRYRQAVPAHMVPTGV